MQGISIVVPVFALVAIGYLCARFRLFSDSASKGLSEFAFGIAMPAQLFRTTAGAGAPGTDTFALWGAYFGTVLIIWGLSLLLTRYVLRRTAADGVSIAMSAVYGNVVMIGLPLTVAALGDAALVPIALILSLNTPVLWLVGSLNMEWVDRKEGASFASVLMSLLKDLSRNPLILSIVAGVAWAALGLGFYDPAAKVLDLLASSGVPCALVALGATLVRFRIQGQLPTLTMIVALKLVVMPAIAWGLAYHIFRLPPLQAAVVVLLCAMPAGANSFLFAVHYNRVVNSASGAVALGTALALVTTAALLSVLIGKV
ncbi:MAG: AEC family transporter [Hyphomicrobiales bacterium]|nr:MAG: AEC family transporter [Hyphomicrobiales bacterium]